MGLFQVDGVRVAGYEWMCPACLRPPPPSDDLQLERWARLLVAVLTVLRAQLLCWASPFAFACLHLSGQMPNVKNARCGHAKARFGHARQRKNLQGYVLGLER